jgi:hypothetical protein
VAESRRLFAEVAAAFGGIDVVVANDCTAAAAHLPRGCSDRRALSAYG